MQMMSTLYASVYSTLTSYSGCQPYWTGKRVLSCKHLLPLVFCFENSVHFLGLTMLRNTKENSFTLLKVEGRK